MSASRREAQSALVPSAATCSGCFRSGGGRGLRGAVEVLVAGELEALPVRVVGADELEVVAQVLHADDQGQEGDDAGQDEVREPEVRVHRGPVLRVDAADLEDVVGHAGAERAEDGRAEQERAGQQELGRHRAPGVPQGHAGQDEQRRGDHAHGDRPADELHARDGGVVLVGLVDVGEGVVDLRDAGREHCAGGHRGHEAHAESDGCGVVAARQCDSQGDAQDDGDGGGHGGGGVEHVVQRVTPCQVVHQTADAHGGAPSCLVLSRMSSVAGLRRSTLFYNIYLINAIYQGFLGRKS